jgi:hypothetical protein
VRLFRNVSLDFCQYWYWHRALAPHLNLQRRLAAGAGTLPSKQSQPQHQNTLTVLIPNLPLTVVSFRPLPHWVEVPRVPASPISLISHSLIKSRCPSATHGLENIQLLPHVLSWIMYGCQKYQHKKPCSFSWRSTPSVYHPHPIPKHPPHIIDQNCVLWMTWMAFFLSLLALIL